MSTSYMFSTVIRPSPHVIFLWVYVKDRVYVPLMSEDIPHLRQRIVKGVAIIDYGML